jgi:hypothetical protein
MAFAQPSRSRCQRALWPRGETLLDTASLEAASDESRPPPYTRTHTPCGSRLLRKVFFCKRANLAYALALAPVSLSLSLSTAHSR